MTNNKGKGVVYRCPICGLEILVLNVGNGNFMPKCCNRLMEIKNEEVLQFYRCDICKSEIAVIEKGIGNFMPKCCNQLMKIIVE